MAGQTFATPQDEITFLQAIIRVYEADTVRTEGIVALLRDAETTGDRDAMREALRALYAAVLEPPQPPRGR